ncbi:lactate utilization protein C [Photobacterium sp.]|uniref:LutC/YkgG family protein n=1 Tax=Photobacterium sp. TaxID=660 RepID=UPI00299F1227|nr:lactate utilization protein C [Photobacterium sp.]MDX1300872.1 lactate utilization protein C [Photobacterium sp.]
MSNARNAILSRLRAAGAQPKPQETIVYQSWHSGTDTVKKQRFIDCLTASHAEIISTNNGHLVDVVENVIASKSLQRIALGTGGEFHQDLLKATQHVDTVIFDRDISDWKKDLFDNVDGGITHSLAGIADTGALVLWPGYDEPRTLSLVPPCHIALIKQSTIADNFTSLMTEQAWQNGMPTNAVLISGPSKTADIQQTLAYGAHGPSQLVVIVIEDR